MNIKIGKIILVIVIIVAFLLLAFAIVKYVPKAFSNLAGVGTSLSDGPVEVMASNTTLNSGDSFNVSWTNELKDAGTYSISYGCVDDFSLLLNTANGLQKLVCDAPFNLGPETREVGLVAELAKENSFIDTPVKIAFVKEGETTPEAIGEVVVTVRNTDEDVLGDTTEEKEVEPSKESTSTPTYSSNTQTVRYAEGSTGSLADLTLSNITPISGTRSAQFTVYNIGGRSTGTWYFNYTTPDPLTQVYTSPAQPSIPAGRAMRVTITYNISSFTNENIVVTLDPQNLVPENNETNNTGRTGAGGGVTGGSVLGASTYTAPTPTYTPTYNTYGSVRISEDGPDLDILDMEVGRIEGGRRIEDKDVREGDDVYIVFEVANRGDEDTGSWRYTIDNTPYDRNDDYRSPYQSSIYPGEVRDVYLEFYNVDEGTYRIEATVDSSRDVREDDERNNEDSVTLRVRD